MLSPTLSSVLAIGVALASLFLFLISFVAPRLYRAQDLWWSGVGMFYALVLWFCSAQIRGAVLLGTIASVALLGWLSTQVYLNRWAALTDAEKAGGSLKRLKALGDQLNGLLESRPKASPDPSPSKPSKVRWVRPEKPAPSEQPVPDLRPESKSPDSKSPKSERTEPDLLSPDPDPALADSLASDSLDPVTSDTSQAISQGIAQGLTPDLAPGTTQSIVQTTSPDPDSPDQESLPSESAPTDPSALLDSPDVLASDRDEWDELETDLEETEAETQDQPIAITQSSKPPQAEPASSVSLFKRVQNFLKGRKSHGKRFVRPEDEAPQSTAPVGDRVSENVSTSTPSAAISAETPLTDPVSPVEADLVPAAAPPASELSPDLDLPQAEVVQETEVIQETEEILTLGESQSPEPVTDPPTVTAPDFSPAPQTDSQLEADHEAEEAESDREEAQPSESIATSLDVPEQKPDSELPAQTDAVKDPQKHSERP